MQTISKALFFFVVLSIFSGSTIAQQTNDYQWLILNGLGKSGIMSDTDPLSFINNHINPVNSSIVIEGIAYPNPEVPNSENSFFAIMQDGSYHLGGGLEGSSATGPYKLRATSDIRYLYLSNIYEEDDPPGGIIVSDNPTPVVNLNDSSSGSTSSVEIKINHDPVHRKDLTIIVENNTGSLISNCTIDFEIFGAAESDFHLQTSELSLGKNVWNYLESFSMDFDGNETPLFNLQPGNTFLNYRVNLNNASPVGKDIDFTLTCPTASASSRSETTNNTISSNHHDPNYVELECVWTERKLLFCKKKYAKYRIGCYNEDTGPVGQLVYTFTLPEKAKPDKINWCYEFAASGTTTASSTRANIEGHNVTYTFISGLAGFPSGLHQNEHTGGLSFCVELEKDTDLEYDDLTIINPISHFDNIPHPIFPFTQDLDCSKPLRQANGQDEVKSHCKRILKRCPCNCTLTQEEESGTANQRKSIPRTKKTKG